MKKDAKSIGFYSWLPSLAPETRDYQHLVYRQDDDVLTDLSNMARLIPAWREGRQLKRLEDLITPMRECYGAPYTAGNDDDKTWLKLAAIVGAHLEVAYLLKKSGFELMRFELEDWREELRQRWLHVRTQDQYDPWKYVLEEHQSDPTSLERICARDFLLGIARGCDTSQAFKREVGNQLFASFGMQLTDVKGSLIPQPTGTVVVTSVGVWTMFLLARMWHGGKDDEAPDVKVCAGCDALFVGGNKGRIYCRKTCADRVYQHNEKVKKAKSLQP